MAIYKTRRGARNYGIAIGILQLDCSLPFIPGDVDNADTYDFPVIYKVVPGLSTKACLAGAPELARAAVESAVALEKQGVRAISSDCGFMLQFQGAVREAVKVPVCMSSLLQLPLIAASLAPARPIAVITADSKNLTPQFLARAGISTANSLIVRGLQDKPEFKTAVFDEKGSIDAGKVETEVIETVRDIVREAPDLGAVLFECSMLPPYARTMQQAVGLPIYDFVTMIDYLQAATHRERYIGYY